MSGNPVYCTSVNKTLQQISEEKEQGGNCGKHAVREGIIIDLSCLFTGMTVLFDFEESHS